MGYYSEVHICAESKAAEKLNQVLSNPVFGLDFTVENSTLAYNGEAVHYSVFVLEQVKWYSYSESVKLVSDLLKEFNQMPEEKGYGYSYLSVGEDGESSAKNNLRGGYLFCDLCVEHRIYDPYLDSNQSLIS